MLNERSINDVLFSCIVPVFNEEKNIAKFLEDLRSHLKKTTNQFEIIVVDDGSSDRSKKIISSCVNSPELILLSLSRNFGKEAALTAGLECCSGDVAVMIDADFQHPIALISDMILHWENGQDMVYGVRKNRNSETFFLRKIKTAFYKMLTYSQDIAIVPNAGDFRLLDRKVIDALNSMPEKYRFMKGLYSWVGFSSTPILYEVSQREAGKKMSFISLCKLAISGITSFSTLPLRLVSMVGIIMSLIGIIYGAYILTQTLLYGNSTPGWTTLVVFMCFSGGIQLVSLGIVGEYISGIFMEVKGRPNYLVSEKIVMNQSSISLVNKEFSKKIA